MPFLWWRADHAAYNAWLIDVKSSLLVDNADRDLAMYALVRHLVWEDDEASAFAETLQWMGEVLYPNCSAPSLIKLQEKLQGMEVIYQYRLKSEMDARSERAEPTFYGTRTSARVLFATLVVGAHVEAAQVGGIENALDRAWELYQESEATGDRLMANIEWLKLTVFFGRSPNEAVVDGAQDIPVYLLEMFEDGRAAIATPDDQKHMLTVDERRLRRAYHVLQHFGSGPNAEVVRVVSYAT